ncbi:tetratricopeptide repeat protein [Motiliproteus sp.]|uniref:tetratricopeptide repeat protein n=1 Tax=Motiliproteus sp. TaxID=1898955 RepID=UPI003BAAF452
MKPLLSQSLPLNLSSALLLMLFLVGCAAPNYNVPIEDRSQRSAGSVPPSTRIDPPASTYTQPDSSQPSRPQPAEPARSYPVEPVEPIESITPSVPQQAPPSAVTYGGPSPALLALMEKADTLESQGDMRGALAQLERAQRISPRDPMVYLQLARLRLHMNDRARAQQLAQRGLSLAGGDPDLTAAFQALLAELKRR